MENEDPNGDILDLLAKYPPSLAPSFYWQNRNYTISKRNETKSGSWSAYYRCHLHRSAGCRATITLKLASWNEQPKVTVNDLHTCIPTDQILMHVMVDVRYELKINLEELALEKPGLTSTLIANQCIREIEVKYEG